MDNKIIIIDDDLDFLKIVTSHLLNSGFKNIRTEDNSITAVSLLEKGEVFDIALIDMTMPEMTGDRLAKEILGIRPDTPIILCTGFSEKTDEKQAIKMGVADYIEKPFDQRDFALKVRKVLDEK